jgi:exodeoxyribonuclease VIII
MADNHCMIDIETMNTGHDAAIITIGAVMFDPRGKDTEESLRAGSKLFGPIDFESNEKEGRSFGAATIQWWLKQSEEARAALVEGNIVSLPAALEQFKQWANSYTPGTKLI